MGDKRSDLIPFLEEALKTRKYGSDLFYVDEQAKVFKINLPYITQKENHQGTKKLLKDWDAQKNRKGTFNYIISHGRMKAALKRSIYLEKCKDDHPKQLTYRILLPEEVKKNERDQPIEERSSSDISQTDAGSSNIEDDSNNLNQDHSLPKKTVRNIDIDLNGGLFNFLIVYDGNSNAFEEGNPSNLYQDHNIGPFSNGANMNIGNSADEPMETEIKMYTFKGESILNEETCIICEEKIIANREETDVNDWHGFVVHSDLFRRIENLELKFHFERDDHLFLYFSLQGNICRA